MPELRYANPWEATDPIRLVHLLEHTTGFDDIDFHHYFLQGKDVPLSKAVDLYGPYRSRWKPGTRSSYCNAGPVIAGRIIEKVTGQSFPEFMVSRLTGPLGMSDTGLNEAPFTNGIDARLAQGYRSTGTALVPMALSDMGVLEGAGEIISTGNDMAKFLRVLSGLAADGNAAPGLELLIDRLKSFKTNDEFLSEIAKQPTA